MKKNCAKDYYLSVAVKYASFIIRFVPLSIGIKAARLLGAVAFYVCRKKRAVAYKNVKTAFPQKPCREIALIVKRACMNSAQHIAELLYLPALTQSYFDTNIIFDNFDAVRCLINDKKGAIFLGLHEGSWELVSMALARKLPGLSYTILSRDQTDAPLLSEMLNSFRAKHGCGIIKITDSLRPLVAHLKKGLALGMAADHGGRDGVLVNFFAKPALTPTGAIKLALKLDTHLLVGFSKRLGGSRHKVVFNPYTLVRTGDSENDILLNLENIHRIYENYIRQSPEEYLWFFKRWKYSPKRNVLILSDGKAGHLKQSLAAAEMLKKLPYDIHCDIVEISRKGNLRMAIFQVCNFFSSPACQGCMGCLRRYLTPDEYQRLSASQYDVIISCGWRLAMANRLLAFENTAKSIVIMKPGLMSVKRFDLVIAPEHDRAPQAANVISIPGALTRPIDEHDESIKTARDAYGLHNLAHPVIGLIIGGDTKYLSLDPDMIHRILDSLKELSNKLPITLLVSTSRRTPSPIEALVRNELKDLSFCKMLLIANENNPAGAFEALLSCSDITLISQDSISMISEALRLSAYTVVFPLKKKSRFGVSKHQRFVEGLEKQGYIRMLSSEGLAGQLLDLWGTKPARPYSDNTEKITQRLKQIL